MIANQQWLDVVSNNLANVNTVGFKRDGIVFHDWMERELRANGGDGPSIGTLGAGPTAMKKYTAWTVGTMTTTDNPLDVAITTPRGLFAVEAGSNPGSGQRNIYYTRDGAFQYAPDGRLVTREGYAVLDQQLRQIYLDPTRPASIDETGNIGPLASKDQQEQSNVRIGLFDGNFEKQGYSLYTSKDAQYMDSGRVQQRALEGSNVNTVETMIQMITVSRAFEMGQKAIQSQDDQTGRLLDSLRGS